jgi:hypothetical protein
VATLSPASGQSGSATISMSAKDAYGQTGSAAATLQVSAPPGSSGGSSGGGHGGGGAFDLWSLFALGGILSLGKQLKARH